MLCTSSLVQSRINANTGTANMLCAITLFRLYNSDFQIFKYSFVLCLNFPYNLCLSSSHPKYLYESFSISSVSSRPFKFMVSRIVFLWPRSIYRYVCMHVWMYTCMYACMYVYMYACMHACMYVCVYGCMYACMYVYMYVCIHLFQYFNEYVRCISANHPYMTTYTHTHTHTHIHVTKVR